MPLKKQESLRINITLHGQVVSWARELKSLGLVRSNADLVCQAVACLHNKIVEERLKEARLKALEKASEE